MESAQQQAAGQQAQWQAQLSQALSGVALPQLGAMFSRVQGQLGNVNALPPDVARAFGDVRTNLNQTFDQQQMVSREAIAQRAKTAGYPVGQTEMSGTLLSTAGALENDRQQALSNLKFQEGQAGMSYYNNLLQLLGQGTQQSLGLATGFGGAAGQAIGGLPQTSPWAGAVGGAASGAAIGSQVYPGWGTAIGAVLGGVGGYLSGG